MLGNLFPVLLKVEEACSVTMLTFASGSDICIQVDDLACFDSEWLKADGLFWHLEVLIDVKVVRDDLLIAECINFLLDVFESKIILFL